MKRESGAEEEEGLQQQQQQQQGEEGESHATNKEGGGGSSSHKRRKTEANEEERGGNPDQSDDEEHEEDGVEDEEEEGVQREEDGQQQPLTKRQLKKMRNLERLKEKRRYQRAQRRLRLKERKKADKEQGIKRGPSKKEKALLQRTHRISSQRVVIDCSFDSVMVPKEIVKLANQVARCYSCNRIADPALDLYLTGFHGQLKEHLNNHTSGFSNWKEVHIEDKHYMEVFNKEELVYLTSDSPDCITTLDPTKVYIIGGIVDHNRLKNITYTKAQEEGIATARLPIDEYLKLSTRKVLTVNHVFEILLSYLGENDWEKAFLSNLPKRKGAQSKKGDKEENEEEEEEEEEVAAEETNNNNNNAGGSAPSQQPTKQEEVNS
ncbi:tRNA methyltransferase 10 [Balamuthia mandrillaris]